VTKLSTLLVCPTPIPAQCFPASFAVLRQPCVQVQRHS